MEWLWGVLVKLLGIGGKGAKDAIEGYDRLSRRQERRLDAVEKRLDECDEDRRELRNKIDECDEHRSRLQDEVTELKTKVSTLEQKTQ